MNIGQSIVEALGTLTTNKLRSALTILGIVIGVAAVISMLAIGRGAQNSITNSINGIGTNLLFVSSGNFTQRVQNPKPLTTEDVTALQNITNAPDVAAVAPVVSRDFTVAANGQTENVQVSGVTPQNETMSNDTTSEGQYIDPTQESSRANVAVIGPTTAQTLFSSTSGVVGNTIRINGEPYQVVGVLASKGGTGLGNQDDRVLIPLTTAEARLIKLNPANRVNQILVQATSASSVSAATDEVSAILRVQHKSKPGLDDFTILAQSAIVSAASSITGILTTFLGGIAGISLLVGGIGIMNIMLVSVTERTREIGLRKALGARKRDILFQFLTESILLSLIGGIVGIFLAWVISSIIGQVAASNGTPITPSIGLDSILLATIFSSAVGLLFGLYPSNRAASLQPVEALRYE
ncbi:MAG TPA: ABC transporter permease [Anaerolineaceae bacterium]|jgi:putative ABC transport system permease protein